MTLLADWAPAVHPLIVHFPIGWWVAAVLVDLYSLAFPRAAWADLGGAFLYPAAAAAALAAYLSGRQAAALALVPGMAHPIVQQHWNWALATTIAFGAVALSRVWSRTRGHSPRSAVRLALFGAALIALALLVQTGHRGARLVFEQGVGVAVPSNPR
jgi:uncharacterized membrane protein